MAINTQKFLPSSGGAIVKGSVPQTSLVPYTPQGKFAMPEVATEDKDVKPSLEEDVAAIRESTVKIKLVLKKSVKIDLKQIRDNRKAQEKTRRTKREDKLETKDDKKESKGPGISVPKVPFFTRVKNFLGSIFLGWLGLKLVQFAPQLSAFLQAIKPIAVWIEGFIGNVFNAFVGFIDGAYDIKAKVENKVEEVFGEDGLKKFKEFQGAFTKFMNLAIIAGMMSAGGTDFGLGKRGGNAGRNQTGIQGMRNQAGRVTRGGTTASAARRFADRYGRDAAIKRFGPEAVQSLGGKYARSAATNTARRAAVSVLGTGGTRASLRVLKNFIQPIVKRIPLIGGLIDFALNYFVFKEPVGRAAFAAIGSTIFGALGAGAGSIVPVVGNIVGAALGGLAGDMAGKWLYDTFFDKKKPVDTPEVEAKERGGQIGLSEEEQEELYKKQQRDNVRRANKFRVTPTPKPSNEPAPDKKNLFRSIFGSLKEKGGPFQYLNKARAKISDGRVSMMSKIMALGIDILSGKPISPRTLQDIAKNMVTFFDSALPAPIALLRSIIQKFSGGGLVKGGYSPIERDRRIRDFTRQLGQQFSRDIQNQQVSIFGAARAASIAAGVRRQQEGLLNNFGGGNGESSTSTPTGSTLGGSDKLAGLFGSSGTVKYDGREGSALNISYSPFAQSDVEAQEKDGGIRITSGKGFRRSTGSDHKGYDVGANTDTPMYAYLDGEVTHVNKQLGGPSDGGYGYWIVWKDGVHGAYHFFGHLHRPPGLSPGAKFKAGSLLGNVGGSGSGSLTAYPPHLHWEISKNPPNANGQFNSYVDPGNWVNTYGANQIARDSVTPSQNANQNADALQTQASYEKTGQKVVIIEKEVVRYRTVTRQVQTSRGMRTRTVREVIPPTALS